MLTPTLQQALSRTLVIAAGVTWLFATASCLAEVDCAMNATCEPESDGGGPLAVDAAADSGASPVVSQQRFDAPSSGDSAASKGPRFDAGVVAAARVSGPIGVRPPARLPSGDCPLGLSACGASCVDARFDIANCGGCGVKCPTIANTIAVCSQGGCASACLDGLALCVDSCVNLQTDIRNCASCGARCTPPSGGTATCEGACKRKCPSEALLCGDDCMPRDDVNHCGACNRRCEPPVPAGSGSVACSAGACRSSCNDGRLLCDQTCCPAPPMNQRATCVAKRCASECVNEPLRCEGGSRPCGGWNFDSGQPEGWAVYPYQASAWDRTPLISQIWNGNRALAAGFDGNGLGKWLLSIEVPLCGGEVVNLTGKTVRATAALQSAEGYTFDGAGTVEVWTTERVVAPTALLEGGSVLLSGTASGEATTLSIEFKISQVWRGRVIIDEVAIE